MMATFVEPDTLMLGIVLGVPCDQILFAIAHGNPWQGSLALPLGVLLGWLYLRTRSLLPCIVGGSAALLLELEIPLHRLRANRLDDGRVQAFRTAGVGLPFAFGGDVLRTQCAEFLDLF